MKIADVAKLSPLDRFLYFVEERESIRLKKEAGEPKPWTDDEILQRYRFCNVRRMDDKVSRWLLDNWYKPYFDHPNMLIACTLARHFNKPNVLEEIGFPETWKPKLVKQQLAMLRNNNVSVFNAAYVIAGDKGWPDKITMVIDRNVGQLVGVKLPASLATGSMRACHTALCEYAGFGSFMAGQVVADLRWAVSGAWTDRNLWAPVGPGSSRGMARLIGEYPLAGQMKQERFDNELQALTGRCRSSLSGSIMDRIEAMDVQNCCCEFNGYEKVLWGQGRKKELYKAGKYEY